MDRWIDRSMDRSIEWSMDGSIKWSINWWIDGMINRSIDGLTDGSIDRLMYWSMDRWFDGLMVWWFDGSIDWRPCRRKRELDRVSVWDREWGFHNYWWQVNTFRDIVYGSQCKCKRTSWLLSYSFLWTCQETAKSKALEIFYYEYARALKGW